MKMVTWRSFVAAIPVPVPVVFALGIVEVAGALGLIAPLLVRTPARLAPAAACVLAATAALALGVHAMAPSGRWCPSTWCSSRSPSWWRRDGGEVATCRADLREQIGFRCPILSRRERSHMAAKQIELGGKMFKASEQFVFIDGAPVSDVSPLAQLRKLTSLVLKDCAQLTDITPLAKCKKINELVLDGTKVADITALAAMRELHTLGLVNTPVEDLSPLERMDKLTFVYLDGTRVRDLGPLRTAPRLRQVSLRRTPVTEISPLQDLVDLGEIDLAGTAVSAEAMEAFRAATKSTRKISFG
jgi:hypothetical protein